MFWKYWFNKLKLYLEKNDVNIDVVNHAEFKEAVNKHLKESKSDILSGIINDFDQDKKLTYSSNIDIMSEWYNVYDWELGENLGEFYEIEVEDLLNEIEERA